MRETTSSSWSDEHRRVEPLVRGVALREAHDSRYAGGHGPGRDVLDHDGVGADLDVVADPDRAEHPRAGSDRDAVADGRVALDPGHRPATQGNPVVQHDVVADLGGLTDDHAHAVVHEEPATDAGTGVYLDPRHRTGEGG